MHCGRWGAGKRDAFKFTKNAVRTDRWRFSNNKELYDITNDPSETENLYNSEPRVVEQLGKAYNQWWESVLPLMVNEGLPEVAPEDQPLSKRYFKQLEEVGIPDWAPDKINE